MPGFESLVDQDRPIRILTAILQRGTIPHGLLFTGTEGVGKKTAATAFAMACNCHADHVGPDKNKIEKVPQSENQFSTDRPCGRCKSCRKIESGNHPDIIWIKPSGVFIKIAQIRALYDALAVKPYEASIRVVIIANAQAMNPAAGNALLKILEEPPVRTILILTANQTSDLLPTIVSRCQHIRFNPIRRKNLAGLLIKRYDLDPADAAVVATMANGSLTRAQIMYQANWVNRRNWLIKELEALSTQHMGRLFALAEKLAKNKEALPDALEVIQSWLRDLIIVKFDPEKIINQDLAEQIRAASQKLNRASLDSKIRTIQAVQNSLQAHTNLRLTLEAMLLKLARQ